MPRALPGGRPSVVLLVVLLAALAVGAAASLLIGAATSSWNPPTTPNELIVPNGVVMFAILGAVGALVLVLVLAMVWNRGRVRSTFTGRWAVKILMVILIGILFVVAARVYSGGGPLPTGAVPLGVNSTGNSSEILPPTQSNATNATPAAPLEPFLIPGVPGWVPYVLVIGVIVVVAVIAVPWIEDRRLARHPDLDRYRAPTQVQRVLEEAAGELAEGRDARDVIIRLYGKLLSRLRPVVGSVDPHTPEEIRTLHLERLGIRHGAAERLTRLFEEARYSSHPLGEGTLAEARSAIDAALADLARVGEA